MISKGGPPPERGGASMFKLVYPRERVETGEYRRRYELREENSAGTRNTKEAAH